MTQELTCPECDSDKVLVRAVTSYWLNTDKFFCHSIKTQDSDAQTWCQTCGWEGQRDQLKESK